MTPHDAGPDGPQASGDETVHVQRSLILFDLDGTLLDTRPAILVGLRHALEIVPGAYERLIGIGMPEVMTWTMAEVLERVAPEQAELCTHRFNRWYRDHAGEMIRPFPGVPELLDRLQRAGIDVGIVSNKGRDRVAPDLDLLALGRQSLGPFSVVVAAEDTAERKPSPEPITFALHRAGRSPADAVHVGDAPQDGRSAVAAGVLFLGAAWGYYGGDALTGDGHSIICRDIEQLGELLGVGAAWPA